jgi:predicted lysophospholipase L1 biosynthesis ABC-type transport system permease subunit
MNDKKYAEDLSHIRHMMENSSKFLSLSGLSGVVAGTLALIGAYLAYDIMYDLPTGELVYNNESSEYALMRTNLMLIGAAILFGSLGIGYLMSAKKAAKTGKTMWNKGAYNMLFHLAIPLAAGGILCFAMLQYGLLIFVAPLTLIFYGLALINASKYTLKEVQYLGICEVILGLISLSFLGRGLMFWAVGFGVLHIIYGGIMYFRHDRG